MRKRKGRPAVLAVLLCLIYCIGLFLGACAVSIYPVFRQKNYFCDLARAIAQEYLVSKGEGLQYTTGPSMRILIYDCSGDRVLYYAVPNMLQMGPDISAAMEKYLPDVLEGREIYHPAFVQEKHRWLNDIVSVVGVPMWQGDRVAGAVFLVKNLMDLPEAIVGYCVYFTIFYWLSAYLLLSNARRRRKLDQLQQNYIANVTHAFKTPIASIKALAETLCDGVEPDPDRQKVYYGMILQEANRQDHMVRDVLELSKLQSNRMDFTKAKLRAGEVFGPVLEKYAALCDCMGIGLHISESFAKLPLLYTNAACMKQLLEILLDNAVKFVPEGGDIWLDASVARGQVTLCVRDNGAGIPKEALPHVFERFFKVNHDFNAAGSGLGLAIAKELCSGLKERIWVESEPGKGTAFFLTVRTRSEA